MILEIKFNNVQLEKSQLEFIYYLNMLQLFVELRQTERTREKQKLPILSACFQCLLL
jgi:hypothetical protein